VAELAESIRQEGLLQPIVVREVEGRFQLIAGERRWRACKTLGLKTIIARIVQVSESSAAVISLIENLQRENLNPVEESLGYASLMRDFDLTQEAVAERVGKPRSSVANSLRLLQLDREVQGYLSKGMLSVGHAKVLLGLEDGQQRVLLARRVVERGLSVRDTERLVQGLRRGRNGQADARARPALEEAAVKDVENAWNAT
jgi:ParB family chromosome partitioning protein